jgi:hypothetical protein
MEIENRLHNNLKQLPVELIDNIISYTYSPQHEDLLMDIHMYHNSMANIHRMFYNTFYSVDNRDIYKLELLDALILYTNNYIPIGHGYHEDFYMVWNRFPLFQKNLENTDINKSKIDEYIEKIFLKKSINTQINMIWGIFTYGERLNFIIDHLEV